MTNNMLQQYRTHKAAPAVRPSLLVARGVLLPAEPMAMPHNAHGTALPQNQVTLTYSQPSANEVASQLRLGQNVTKKKKVPPRHARAQ